MYTTRSILLRVFIGLLVMQVVSGCSAKTSMTSEAEAMDIIKSRPETMAFAERLEKVENVSIFMKVEGGGSESEAYDIYVGESHPTHTVLWNRFRVNKLTKRVYVYDVGSDTYIPIEQWEK